MINPADMAAKTDQELVELALEDREFFAWIISRYKDKLYNYISRITNASAQEAEDILQEVFIKTYRNLNEYDPELKFSSWIYRIAHNQTISHYRKEKVRPLGNAIPLDIEEIKNLAADTNIEKDIDLELMRESIYSVLDSMDEKYRELLVLKYFEEKSYKEISDILKKPIGTVATMLMKAKKDFKNEAKKQKLILNK
jgi:RNA polymerase sigma-70 factor, ECF subfamily